MKTFDLTVANKINKNLKVVANRLADTESIFRNFDSILNGNYNNSTINNVDKYIRSNKNFILDVVSDMSDYGYPSGNITDMLNRHHVNLTVFFKMLENIRSGLAVTKPHRIGDEIADVLYLRENLERWTYDLINQITVLAKNKKANSMPYIAWDAPAKERTYVVNRNDDYVQIGIQVGQFGINDQGMVDLVTGNEYFSKRAIDFCQYAYIARKIAKKFGIASWAELKSGILTDAYNESVELQDKRRIIDYGAKIGLLFYERHL